MNNCITCGQNGCSCVVPPTSSVCEECQTIPCTCVPWCIKCQYHHMPKDGCPKAATCGTCFSVNTQCVCIKLRNPDQDAEPPKSVVARLPKSSLDVSDWADDTDCMCEDSE